MFLSLECRTHYIWIYSYKDTKQDVSLTVLVGNYHPINFKDSLLYNNRVIVYVKHTNYSRNIFYLPHELVDYLSVCLKYLHFIMPYCGVSWISFMFKIFTSIYMFVRGGASKFDN